MFTQNFHSPCNKVLAFKLPGQSLPMKSTLQMAEEVMISQKWLWSVFILVVLKSTCPTIFRLYKLLICSMSFQECCTCWACAIHVKPSPRQGVRAGSVVINVKSIAFFGDCMRNHIEVAHFAINHPFLFVEQNRIILIYKSFEVIQIIPISNEKFTVYSCCDIRGRLIMKQQFYFSSLGNITCKRARGPPKTSGFSRNRSWSCFLSLVFFRTPKRGCKFFFLFRGLIAGSFLSILTFPVAYCCKRCSDQAPGAVQLKLPICNTPRLQRERYIQSLLLVVQKWDMECFDFSLCRFCLDGFCHVFPTNLLITTDSLLASFIGLASFSRLCTIQIKQTPAPGTVSKYSVCSTASSMTLHGCSLKNAFLFDWGSEAKKVRISSLI